eukprot:GSA25T00015405001.1
MRSRFKTKSKSIENVQQKNKSRSIRSRKNYGRGEIEMKMTNIISKEKIDANNKRTMMMTEV